MASSPLKQIAAGAALASSLPAYYFFGGTKTVPGVSRAQQAIQNSVINKIKYPNSFPTNLPGGLYGPPLPSAPYAQLGATQGINMSGGIPYGAVNSSRFFNGSGGLGTGMYSPGIPMGAGRLPVAGPGIPMGPGPLPVTGPGIPMGASSGATQAARGGLLSVPQGGPGNALLAETNTLAVPRGYGYGTVLADGGTLRLNGSNLTSGSNLVNEVPVTIRSGVTGGGGGIPVMPAGALEAGTAAETATNAGLLARLGYAPAGTTGLSRFIAEGLTPKAALGRLALGATAGQLGASMIVDPLNIGGANSAADRFATGATFGAGLGAAVGNVIPIPGVGAGIGALAGAGIGGLGNVIMGMFDDNSKADQTKKNQKRMSGLNGLMETAGLTDNQRQQYMAQYNTQLEILRGQGQDNASNVAKLLDATEQQISKSAGSNAGKLTSKDMVALQAAIGQYMQPLIQQQQVSGDTAAQLYNQMAGNMGDSAMANLVRGQAAGYKAQADRLSAAYMAQAQAIPALYGLQQMGQLANQKQSTQSADLLSQLQAAQ